MADRDRSTVTVVTRLDPQNDFVPFEEGDQMIVGGLIVDGPAEAPPGYRGDEPRVIYVTDQLVRLP